MADVYVSTIAFAGMPIEQIIDLATENGWPLEFSSGLPNDPKMQEIYLACQVKRLAHNYFPAPAEPFVLNLASSNEQIRRRSIEHCINGLEISRASGSPFFAAHAGFCIDPAPIELGQQLKIGVEIEREKHWNLFIDSVREVVSAAADRGQDFLIENNVLAPFNLKGVNPLFCCESGDFHRLFEEIRHPSLGMLLDTAHLKVSCQTLGFDLREQLTSVSPYVRALHHSDNDGRTDSNSSITEEYWFLPFMQDFAGKVHVLEVKNLVASKVKEQINLLQQYAVN